MEKAFLEVFRNLELVGELRALLEEVVVTKVSINQKRDHVRIYIRSRQWIHKKYIYTLEHTIASQCFPGVPMKVKILERFDLSSQYTPEIFLDAYRSSMALELPELKELVSLMRYSSNNLNQLTRRVHETGRIYDADLEDISRRQEALWDGVHQVLTQLAKLT